MKTQTIFTIKRDSIIQHNFRYKKFSSCELLKFVEDILKSKGQFSTGLGPFNLPDQDWLRNVLLHLEPSDPHGVLDPAPNHELVYNIEVNSEYEFFHIFLLL